MDNNLEIIDFNTIKVAELTADELLSNRVINAIYVEQDEFLREGIIQKLALRARDLRIKGAFDSLIDTKNRIIREERRREEAERMSAKIVGITQFDIDEDEDFENMDCGAWIANEEEGVIGRVSNSAESVRAAYMPILPIRKLRNEETGTEKIELAFKEKINYGNNVFTKWVKKIFPSSMISTAKGIINLSDYGFRVTDTTAKYLVAYLADVENANTGRIETVISSTKLGWHRDNIFLPYDESIQYDGSDEFRDLKASIGEFGSGLDWLKHVQNLRKSGKVEIKLAIASSLSSILVAKLGTIPFVVDFYGESGHGKTVLLKLAASCWANPKGSVYIGNFESTTVAMEARADTLNSLPVLLDDTSNAPGFQKENALEELIYKLTSGKGRSRSNVNLGLNRELRWWNCFIVNGERPLSSYYRQGGAINRTIECRCAGDIFDDPRNTAGIVDSNYGFAGVRFVDIVKKTPEEDIKAIYDEFVKRLSDGEHTAKQAMAMSVILTADKLATDGIFNDGEYIKIDDISEMLATRDEMSDNQRCYEYICDKVQMNDDKFNNSSMEQWGFFDDRYKGYVLFYPIALKELCEAGHFSKTGFLSWAKDRDILITDNGRKDSKIIKIYGSPKRMHIIKLLEYQTPFDKEIPR